jgi:pilus assembly protein Flp/PilA
MIGLTQAFLADKSAATSIEYGLIAAGVAIAIVITVTRTGGALNKIFCDSLGGILGHNMPEAVRHIGKQVLGQRQLIKR